VEKGKEGRRSFFNIIPLAQRRLVESCAKPMISRRRQGSERDHGFCTGSAMRLPVVDSRGRVRLASVQLPKSPP
jgi:hypothetical protein